MKKQRKHKWKYRINLRNKILVLIILGVFLFVGLGYAVIGSNLGIFGTLEVSKYDKTLYAVLKRETIRGYASKYTGAHQDSIDPSKSTEDIYHFYGSTAAKGTEILNKNNVLFADKCWQMIRTTDTGGVKLLYNGEPETSIVNGETIYNCGNNRSLFHMGEILSEISLGGTIRYAKNYTMTMNGNNMVFTLVDDPDDPDDYKAITINSSNAQSAIEDIAENYPYTCRNANTCQNLYFFKVAGYTSGASANVYTATYRDRIGNTQFNTQFDSPAHEGYMYGDVYPYSTFEALLDENFTTSVDLNTTTITLGTGYYYADSYDYGETTANTYTLTSPTQITGSTNYSTLVGKYIINGATAGSSINYVIGIGENNSAYVKTLSNGDIEVSIKLSDSITDNGNGTYTLDSPITTVELKNWYTDYASYIGKYTCGDSNTTCSSPKFIGKTTSTTYGYIDESQTMTLSKSRSGLALTDYVTITMRDYFDGYNTTYKDYVYTCGNNDTTCTKTNLRYIKEKNPIGYMYYPNLKFGSSVIYENNKYKLQNVEGLETLGNSDTFSTHHYTCVDLGEDECTSVAYVYLFLGTAESRSIHYVELNDPNITDINTALDNMFTKNITSSNIKNKVEEWYEANLKDTIYEAKLDDTIYCNDRSIRTTGSYTLARSGWNPNGGKLNQTLGFKEVSLSKDLNCTNLTDRFSVSNNDAKLTYKIGLLTAPEANLLNQTSARDTPYYYWLLSPTNFNNTTAVFRTVNIDGGIGSFGSRNSLGVRPVISLIAGTEYTKGDGSMTNPYIVRMD